VLVLRPWGSWRSAWFAAAVLAAVFSALSWSLTPGSRPAAAATGFGGTFLGAVTLALAVGSHLRVAHSAAVLTTGYAVGQIAGPLLVTPLLNDGYAPALLTGSLIVAAGAAAAAVLRHRYPGLA
jgi:hypothetical protein